MEGDLELEDESLIFSVEDYKQLARSSVSPIGSTSRSLSQSSSFLQRSLGESRGREISSPARVADTQGSFARQASVNWDLVPSTSPWNSDVTSLPAAPQSSASRTIAHDTVSERLLQSDPSPSSRSRSWLHELDASGGSLDDSTCGMFMTYRSAEAVSPTTVGVAYDDADDGIDSFSSFIQSRSSASKIIDYSRARRVASKEAVTSAMPLLSTSFDSEFELNTELVAHKGAFRDTVSMRDEQLLMRLRQKQRELKQMEAALVKKQEEYLLLKTELEARKKKPKGSDTYQAEEPPDPSMSPTESESARTLQIFHRLTTAPRRSISEEVAPNVNAGDGSEAPDKVYDEKKDTQLELFRPSEPEVFSCGSNRNGVLGLGSDQLTKTEECLEVEFLPRCARNLSGKRVYQVAIGTALAAALTEDGEVYTWGRTSAKGVALLGHGPSATGADVPVQTVPRRVVALTVQVKQVAVGSYHTLCLASDGRVFAWGLNDRGQCGTGDCVNIGSPALTKEAFNGPAVQIACGGRHSACLNSAGHLFMFGSGEFGQLGLGDLQYHSYPRQVTAITSAIKSVACGSRHTALVTVGGEAYTFGDGKSLGFSSGVLPVPQYIRLLRGKCISRLSCGSCLTAALTETGDVYVWGNLSFTDPLETTALLKDNSSDKLGGKRENKAEESVSPRRGSASGASKATAVGEIVPRLLKIDGIHNRSVRYVACGSRHIACITDNGRVMCFGSNKHGQLGTGSSGGAIHPRSATSPTVRAMKSLTPPERSRKYSLDGNEKSPRNTPEREHTSDLSFLHDKPKSTDNAGEGRSNSDKKESEGEQSQRAEEGVKSKRGGIVVKKLRQVRLVACAENSTVVLIDEYRSNRDKLVWDLLQSERSYVRILNIIVQIFYRPLCQRIQESKSFLFSEKLLSMEEVDKIFGNVEQLLEFQRSLLNKLDFCMCSWPTQLLGDIFLNTKELLPLYTRYCAGTTNAVTILNNASSNRSLSSFLAECTREAEVYRKKEDDKKEFSLSSLLLEPTIRIHKYLSYFREILAHTPKDHPDYENLDAVTIHFRQIVKKLTDDQNQHEYMRLVAKIRGLKQLMKPSRVFVSQTHVTLIGESNRNPPCSLLLYNDLLCFCSAVALEYEMPLHTVWIRANPPDVEDPARTFAVLSVERTFLVKANSEHERLAFINNAHSKIAKLLGRSELDDTKRTFKYTFTSGAVYEGQWMWGKFNGMGTYERNGEKYEGEWVDGLREGFGTYYNKKGGRYEGYWQAGKREGHGTQHFAKGSGYDKFIGSWVDDKRHDEGYLYFENGDVFFATWDKGVLTLPCSVLYVNGDKYVGDWSGKAPHGYGIYTYTKSSDRFYGSFHTGLRSGSGFLRTGDGCIYNGEWLNDRIHGRGYVLVPDRFVLDARALDGDSLDKLTVANATWMKSVARDVDELNIERWNYFIGLKCVRDPKNLAVKQLEDNLKKTLEGLDPSPSAFGDAVKVLIGDKTAHPLGGVVVAFAKLFNRNYRPAEDCYKFFDDALDDTHSFIEAIVQQIKKACPRIEEMEDANNWCISAVESVVFPLIFTTIFAMYEIKNENQDAEVETKLIELRKMSLSYKLSLLGLHLESKQIAEMIELERRKREEEAIESDKTVENDQDGPKQESASWRRRGVLNSSKDGLLPFQGAIDKLSKLPGLVTPAEKLQCIYLASKEIEHCMPATTGEREGMSADELLPVLAFILSHANIPNISSELNFLEEFMSKHLRFEVEGYLLTHLQVALQFLKSLDLEKRRMEEMERQRRKEEEKRLSSRSLRLSFPLIRIKTRE